MNVSYRKNGDGWEGTLKDENGCVIWTCGHYHRNRDISSRANGKSAISCAESERLRRIPAYIEAVRRTAW